jgi:hypothetical protein
MITIEKVDTDNRAQIRRFVQLPHRLYKGCAQWVPPLNVDAYSQLNRTKHPFHEHSDVEFFLAVREGRDVGRIAAIENKPFNRYHNTREADFYFFECENDPESAAALFEAVFGWSRARGLDSIIGPKGLGPLDGYGLHVLGFEHRQTMTMLNYNYEYYPALVEAQGFVKEVDFVSCYLPAGSFQVPGALRAFRTGDGTAASESQTVQEQKGIAAVGAAHRAGVQQGLCQQLGILSADPARDRFRGWEHPDHRRPPPDQDHHTR